MNLATSLKPDDFLAFAIGLRLTPYVKAKLEGRTIPAPMNDERPLLDYALRGVGFFPNHCQHEWMTKE